MLLRGPARGIIWLAVLAVAAVVVGCGGNGATAAPLDRALSYMQPDVAAVVVIPTDLEDGPLAELDRLGESVDGWDDIKATIRSQLESEGGEFERIQRQLGNPAVVAVGSRAGTTRAALQIADPKAEREEAERQVAEGEATRLDDYKGALIYRPREGLVLAIHDEVLIQAESNEQVRVAIDASEGSDNLSHDDEVTAALEQLGEDRIVRVVADLQEAIDSGSGSAARRARDVPWVKALDQLTASARVEGDQLLVDVAVSTGRQELREQDLPIAGGSEAPPLHSPGALATVALRDPGRIVAFGESVAKAIGPKGYEEFRQGIDQVRSTLDVDIRRDLLERIETLSVAADATPTPRVTFVGKLSEPDRFADALAKVPLFIQGLISGASSGEVIVRREGEGEEAVYIVQRGDDELARYGVRDEALVGSVLRGGLPPGNPGEPVAGAEGALGAMVDGERAGFLGRLSGQLPRTVTEVLSALGQMELEMRSEPEQTTARASFKVR